MNAASTWADAIALLDDNSTDRTGEIAGEFSKVSILRSELGTFNEGLYRLKTIEHARRMVSKLGEGRQAILIWLDADEMLSGNLKQSDEWKIALRSPPGTVIRLPLVELLPDRKTCWNPHALAIGYVDDGAPFVEGKIHIGRLPWPPKANVVDVNDVALLHLHRLAPLRNRSKQRWYQAWECDNFPEKRAVQIFRQYNQHLHYPKHEIFRVKEEWIRSLSDQGIDVYAPEVQMQTWWDSEVLERILVNGAERYRKLDIWDADYSEFASSVGCAVKKDLLSDPRNQFDKGVHFFLRMSQKSQSKLRTRIIQWLLRLVGW